MTRQRSVMCVTKRVLSVSQLSWALTPHSSHTPHTLHTTPHTAHAYTHLTHTAAPVVRLHPRDLIAPTAASQARGKPPADRARRSRSGHSARGRHARLACELSARTRTGRGRATYKGAVGVSDRTNGRPVPAGGTTAATGREKRTSLSTSSRTARSAPCLCGLGCGCAVGSSGSRLATIPAALGGGLAGQ